MPRPRSATDSQIIAATVAAIGKHGPAKLTLAHIADEIGLSPAALVQRFGSKAGLMAAVASDAAHHADAAFDQAQARTESPVEAVVEAMVAFAGDLHDRTELANHLAMLQLDLTDPELRRHTVAQARVVRTRIRRLLEEATATGELRATDLDELTQTIHAAYTGAALTWAIDGSGDLADWIRRRVSAVLDPHRTRPPARS